ncbi:MAG TPA: hypothetical protein VMT64_12985 [Candidatus Binataceae bacterium]|nr:hypothetical protein [Candidatus Binataceae bacterium]
MRCVYCRARAGLIRRTCLICAKVIQIVDRAGGQVGFQTLVDIFKSEGLTQRQVDTVFDARIGKAPTIRDRLTSQMTNALMRGLGMPGRQSPEDVMRVRESMNSEDGQGTYVHGQEPGAGSH